MTAVGVTDFGEAGKREEDLFPKILTSKTNVLKSAVPTLAQARMRGLRGLFYHNSDNWP